jgi:hypothetical protein
MPSSLKRLASNAGDGKVPGNVRLALYSGDNLLVQLGRQANGSRIFLRLRPDRL